jgi:cytochrome c556
LIVNRPVSDHLRKQLSLATEADRYLDYSLGIIESTLPDPRRTTLMLKSLRNYLIAGTAAAGLLLAPLAVSHFDDKEVQQSYRQSWFALVAMNFGPMASTVKGEIPWNDEMMQGWAGDLTTLTTLNIMRGFGDGSDKGTTRAKPEIWENKADFESKMGDLKTAVGALR